MPEPSSLSNIPPALAYRALVIAGPTGVGKSALALEVAERCGGEIVGADAFQIYDGLDTLTAKPSPEERARVPHHLIGAVPLTQAFDVGQYLALATARLAEIRARGKVPVVVGGTGLYIRALLCGLADVPPADAALRAELEKVPLGELQSRLRERDPVGAAAMDLQNPRRVIRALEVCLLTGRAFSSFRQEWAAGREGAPVGVWLDRAAGELRERIGRRTAEMFRSGVVEEVRQAPHFGPTAEQTLGLREIRACLAGEMEVAECEIRIAEATRRYAKRQRTWFRREERLVRLELPHGEPMHEILQWVR